MPTIISHGLAAYTLAKLSPVRWHAPWLLVVAVAVAILPDLDVVTFRLGIPYASPWGHRGFSHSIAFALLVALSLAGLLRHRLAALGVPWYWGAILFFICMISHALLDMITDATHGPALFAPFSNTRYLASFTPIPGSPLTLTRLLSERGLQVVIAEIVWIALPCACILALAHWRRWKKF